MDIESQQALFRGPSFYRPEEIWNFVAQSSEPYWRWAPTANLRLLAPIGQYALMRVGRAY